MVHLPPGRLSPPSAPRFRRYDRRLDDDAGGNNVIGGVRIRPTSTRQRGMAFVDPASVVAGAFFAATLVMTATIVAGGEGGGGSGGASVARHGGTGTTAEAFTPPFPSTADATAEKRKNMNLPSSAASPPLAFANDAVRSFPPSAATTSCANTKFRLHLHNFVHPYGVFPDDDDTDDRNRTNNVELIEALLNDGEGYETGKERTKRSEEAFQRALLTERLRLCSKSRPMSQNSPPPVVDGVSEYFNREEAFQRALLEERLRVKYDAVGSVDGIEADSRDAPFVPAAATARGGGSSYSIVDNMHHRLDHLQSSVRLATSPSSFAPLAPHASVSEGGDVRSGNASPLNSDSHSLQQQNHYLPMPPREDASLSALLLAPLAHVLSSLFHLVLSTFCAARALVDAALHDSDVRRVWAEALSVWKAARDYVFRVDNAKEEGKREALSSVFDSAGAVVASSDSSATLSSWARRTGEALLASLAAFALASKCHAVRAFYVSIYADRCLDSFAGTLRYATYAVRATKVLWRRCAERWFEQPGRRNSTPLLSLCRRKLRLLRILSNIRSEADRRELQTRLYRVEQERLRSGREVEERLSRLNADRVELERTTNELDVRREELDMREAALLVEGAVCLAWYCAARTEAEKAGAAAEAKKDSATCGGGGCALEDNKRSGRWRIWRKFQNLGNSWKQEEIEKAREKLKGGIVGSPATEEE